MIDWLRYPGITLDLLTPWLNQHGAINPELAEEIAEDAAYAPYVARQDSELRDLRASEAVALASDFPYRAIPGLSAEMAERLAAAQPATLAAAGRVAGITPAALATS